ncbi:CHASE2 domain-containing protein [Cupriavidus sp. 2MCAB6]|uniref:CHASE2 domain-containing protein n=1 Tax=Cupriavidus sp. 2MCAB6 TaxID=3232981 RepID=UPI003F91EF19
MPTSLARLAARAGSRAHSVRRVLARILAGYQRRTLIEWAVLTAAVLALVVACAAFGWSERADTAVYDLSVAAQHHAPSDDIVIVTIDDPSISAIGRWPWRRWVLADLIGRIAADAPRVIGVDVILSEPDQLHPEDDRALAGSMARAGNVVLPALAEAGQDGLMVRYPLTGLGAGVGHINIAVDLDGIARQVFLQEGLPGRQLNHFSVAMVGFGEPPRPVSSYRHDDQANDLGADGWMRNYRLRIPFAGPPGTFRLVSVLDVLGGALPADFFRGKSVLIGATASGLGDVFPTPVSRSGHGMSGVEIIANAMQTLQNDSAIVTLPAPWFWLCTLLPVLLASLASLATTPRNALLVTAVLLIGSLAASLLLVVLGHLWFAPASALLGCSLFYPLWSWRRQEAALKFLTDELAQLEQEPGLLAMPAGEGESGRNLDTRMRAVYRMTTRLRDLRQFLSDGLEGLPEATVICDPSGRVLLANRRGLLLAPRTLGPLADMSAPRPGIREMIDEVFAQPKAGLDYWDQLRSAFADGEAVHAEPAQAPPGVELEARGERPMLLRGAPLRSDTGGVAGLIVSVIDITQVRVAERRREESLRFISHDMRSPQSSILALIDLQNEPGRALPEATLLARIGEHASRTLDLADDFIRLARAEAPHLSFVEVDLAGVVLDATDELWALASAARIALKIELEEEQTQVVAEPVLLVRAIANLVSNAIKFSPPQSTVTVRLYRVPKGLAIDVADQGRGIAEEDQGRLFQPFARLHGTGRDAPAGSGLGLVFVKTVVERHGGEIRLVSATGAGATFTIILPC